MGTEAETDDRIFGLFTSRGGFFFCPPLFFFFMMMCLFHFSFQVQISHVIFLGSTLFLLVLFFWILYKRGNISRKVKIKTIMSKKEIKNKC